VRALWRRMSTHWLLVETVVSTHRQVIETLDTEDEAWELAHEIDEFDERKFMVVAYDPDKDKEQQDER
jgi:hypothetical protein